MKNRQYQIAAAVLMCGMLVTACGDLARQNADAAAVAGDGGTGSTEDRQTGEDAAYTGTTIDSSDLFSDRDLSGAYEISKCDSITLSDTGCTTDSRNVEIDGSTVTVTGEGDYIVSGALSDGMIIVDVDKSEKVQLVLNGVDITSETSAAIYVRKADKVFVTLADGTENTLKNGGTFEEIDDNHIDAVLFSKDDLTLNGTGTLIIDSPADHGIVSKNELTITNGTYRITAASHGMTGKDGVAVADGSFEITAGKDAIQSKNEDDDTLGSVYIADGEFVLNVESDGISAVNEIYIAGGTITVEESYEGLEARIINISGGEVDITSRDDGLNATDRRVDLSAEVSSQAETAADDASKRAVTGNDRSAWDDDDKNNKNDRKRGFPGGMGDTQADAGIHISGGVIRIDAEGDGVDSNGYITVSGGELYVTGPSSGKDGALDYGINATVSGGIVVAAGQSGMAQNFSADSTQGTILVNTQQQNAAGSEIALLDTEGEELIVWTMEKACNSVVISCPEIRSGGSYIVKIGGTSTEITMDGLVYGEGFSFGAGRGGRPEG